MEKKGYKRMFLLEVKNLTKRFGGLVAVNGLDFKVIEGEILAIIGPNGAGKSTLFNLVTAYYKPSRGTILFRGQKINNLKTHQIAKLGIARSFQKTSVFMDMTVSENVSIAQHLQKKVTDWEYFFFNSAAKKETQEFIKNNNEILRFLGLFEYKDRIARTMPYGVLRLLEIAITLAIKPKLILLDEPFTGMNRGETDQVMKIVKKLQRDRGLTILLIEHNMQAVMTISDRIVVMNFGNKIAEGKPSNIAKNPEVIEAYLGKTMNREGK
ncbi:MAG: ABC transporter ATP-binding protein [Atribacterota bacterium]|nr:ABC transporter ATP-binding protein [Atribacterota bacterium]